MEFWGIEVTPGQTVKCEPGCERLLHLSQASLGESKKVKGSENVPIFVKVNDQKLVLGTLSSEKCAQISFDLVFEKEFELSHGSKDISVFFVGYRSIFRGNEFEDGFYDSDSEDDLQIDEKSNGKPSSTEQGKSTADKAAAVKDDNTAAKLKTKSEKPYKEQVKVGEKGGDNTAAKLKAKSEKPCKEQVKVGEKVDGKNDEDDSSDEDDDEDEDMFEGTGDSSDEEDESSEEEAIPEKVTTGKKREAGSASKTPIPEKKAKVVSPAGNQKTGGDGKKGVHIATPHPAKQGGKPQQSPKSGGLTCKYCSRNFNGPNALEAHTRIKHSAAK